MEIAHILRISTSIDVTFKVLVYCVDKYGNRSPDFFIEAGSPRNPMGAAALVLADNELAIHGTNNPSSIGGFVSAGCIRMHNKDILRLARLMKPGTPLLIL